MPFLGRACKRTFFLANITTHFFSNNYTYFFQAGWGSPPRVEAAEWADNSGWGLPARVELAEGPVDGGWGSPPRDDIVQTPPPSDKLLFLSNCDPEGLSKDTNLAYLGIPPVSIAGLLKWVKCHPVTKSKITDMALTRIWIKFDFKINGMNIQPFKNLIKELSRDDTMRIIVFTPATVNLDVVITGEDQLWHSLERCYRNSANISVNDHNTFIYMER